MARQQIRFIVFNEHTFGYTHFDIRSVYYPIKVMAVDYMKGGDPQLLDKRIIVLRDKSRLARLSDFEHFKVSPNGYIDNEDYIFDRTQ